MSAILTKSIPVTVAVDPGSKMGLSVWSQGAPVCLLRASTATLRGEHPQRWATALDHLSRLVYEDRFTITHLFYEEVGPMMVRSINNAKVLIGLIAHIEAWCYHRDVRYIPVNNQRYRKWGMDHVGNTEPLGRRERIKEQMKDVARRLLREYGAPGSSFLPQAHTMDDNTAEAIVLGCYGAAMARLGNVVD